MTDAPLVDPKSIRAGTFQGGAPDTVRDAGFYARKRKAEAEAGRALTPDEFRAGGGVDMNAPAQTASLKGGATLGLTTDPYRSSAGEPTAAQSGTSIFDPVLTELAYKWFCPPGGLIIDPFAGGSVRGIVASVLGFRYAGFELRSEQIAANRAQAEAICPAPKPEWIEGDSRETIQAYETQGDFVFSCPPYGDLEVYSDLPGDLSNMAHDSFLGAYRAVVAASVAKLKPHRFAAFVVGDYRDGKGFYRNFVGETVAAFEAAGARLYNEAVLITAVGSLPVRVNRQFKAGRKLGKTHQNVLVFCKGDPKRATASIEGGAS